MQGARGTVIVTDGDERSALATTRSLGRAGWRVVIGSRSGHSLAGASRYAASDRALPDALVDPAAYVDAVGALVHATEAGVVLPMTESSALALLPERDALAPARIPFPDAETFRRICDKETVLCAARDVGIDVPAQWRLGAPDEAAGALADRLPYPVVLKPFRSVVGEGAARRKLSVRHAASPAELRERVAALPPEAFPVLVQQRIVGPGIGVFLLLWEGREIARFGHRRIREKPPSGGVSVYRESVVPDPALVERSQALLERFGWSGVAMVEYKVDARTGRAYLMEINGRLWGSLQLAIDAGVDFPALLLDSLEGRPPASPPPYRAGVRSRWWWGDVDSLLVTLRRSRSQLDVHPDEWRGRWRSLADFVRVRRGDRNEILRLGDPMPFVRETVRWFAQL